jgi:hypothetical protein
MFGGASATETDEATMAKVDVAEATKSSREATLVDAGKVVVKMALTLPQTGDQPGGHGGEREIHTISSGEPPKPHGKEVLDTEVSSMAEMAIPSVSEGPEVEESLAIVLVGTDPRVDSVPVFVRSSEEVEEAHWAVLGGFERLAD